MSGSAISTTNSETDTLRTFASLRFRGDRLEPGLITEILSAGPTIAYRKGEIFKRSRGHEVRGRTGVWLLSSAGHVSDLDLNAHLRYLLGFLPIDRDETRLAELQELMREQHLKADVTCFWYGEPGAFAPVILDEVRTAFAQLPAVIDADFHSD